MKKIENYLAGKIASSNSNKFLPVDNPSTGEKIAEVVLSNKEDFNQIVNDSLKQRIY